MNVTVTYIPYCWYFHKICIYIYIEWYIFSWAAFIGTEITGVGIDVPIIGDLFHITKTNICWR